MTDDKRHTPTPWDPEWEGPVYDTDRVVEPTEDASALMPLQPVSERADPHSMTTRELLIEAVIFGRAHGEIHTIDQKRLADGDKLFKQLDAEIEMLGYSFQTILRKLGAEEAADKLGAYWDDKRKERNARSDKAGP